MDDLYVSMKNAGRTYSQGGIDYTALESATCRVAPGDRIAVVGPSGSGKSTLLHLMGGIDAPTTGSVTWPALGKRENLRPRKIGFVFQTVSLVTSLTAIENIELPILLSHGNPGEAHETAMRTLERIGLESLADKLPEELSGGQAQRIAVARALALRPKLILADEPTGQLDHPTAQRLLDVLLESIDASDVALVVATHDSAIAGRMKTVWRIEYGSLEVGA